MMYVKISVDKAKVETIKDFYRVPSVNYEAKNYICFQITNKNNIQITAYRTKNPEVFTILFQGEKDVELEARQFSDSVTIVDTENSSWETKEKQIGSDEVGVGDFFGPIVVVASYLEEKDIEFIDSLKIKDSKRLNDAKIFALGEQLVEKIKFTKIVCDTLKIEDLTNKGWSMHKIMANLHNRCHQLLIDKYHLNTNIPVYIDQFEKPSIYTSYCLNLIPNHLIFKTKGESYYPSVATSSVIARYIFLRYWNKMEEDLQIQIPKGASSEVDKIYKKLKSENNEKVEQYVKKNFRNYQS